MKNILQVFKNIWLVLREWWPVAIIFFMCLVGLIFAIMGLLGVFD